MKRRELIHTTLAAGAALAAPRVLWAQNTATPAAGAKRQFKLRYAPHFGQFSNSAGNDPVAQLQYMADQGFRAFEDNGMRGKSREDQERIAREAVRLGMEMGIFVVNDDGLSKPILTSGDAGMRDKFLQNIRDSVEVAKRVNTKYATLVVGNADARLQRDYQTANVIETSSVRRPSANRRD
jgi:hydroxypyruvate isomerase